MVRVDKIWLAVVPMDKLNDHDSLAYLRNILERLPTQPNHQIHLLLPHHWQPAQQ